MCVHELVKGVFFFFRIIDYQPANASAVSRKRPKRTRSVAALEAEYVPEAPQVFPVKHAHASLSLSLLVSDEGCEKARLRRPPARYEVGT
jgi:hypothetical protein